MGNKNGGEDLLLAPGVMVLVYSREKWRLGIIRTIERDGTAFVEIRMGHRNMNVEVLRKDMPKRIAPLGSHPIDESADPTLPFPVTTVPNPHGTGSARRLVDQDDLAVADAVSRKSGMHAPVAAAVAIPKGFFPVEEPELVDVLDKSNPYLEDTGTRKKSVKPPQLVPSKTIPPPPTCGWRWRPAIVEAMGPGNALFVRFMDVGSVPPEYAESAVVSGHEEADLVAEHEMKSAPQIAQHPYTVGDVLDVEDVYLPKKGKGVRKKWRKCQIIRIVGAYWLRVTFVGWSRAYDEWFHVLEQSDRLAEFGSQTEKDLARKEGLDAIFTKNLQADRALTVFQVDPDGNCLFNAVAHQVYGDVERHDIVRADCCDYLEKNKERFQVLLETGQFDEYLNNKRKLKVWGDDPEVRAMEELYDRPVEVYVAQGVGTHTEPLKLHFDGDLPSEKEMGSYTPIRLSFHGKNHYNSVIPFVARDAVNDKGEDVVEDVSAETWQPPPMRMEGVIRRHRRAQMAEHRASAAPGFAVASNDLEDVDEEDEYKAAT